MVNYAGICVVILVITACIAVLMKVLSESVLNDIDKRKHAWAKESSKIFREEFGYVMTEFVKTVKETTKMIKEEEKI